MRDYFSILFAFLFFFFNQSFPGDNRPACEDSLNAHSKSVTTFHLIKYDFNKTLDDGLEILKAPAHFSGKDWALTGVIAGGTAISMLLDNDIRNGVKRNQSSALDDITKVGRYYGEVVPAISLSAGIYAAGLIFKDRSISLTGRLLAESLLYAGAFNAILKLIFSRSRPYNNKGNTDFGNYNFNNDYYSLPSGHTTVAFTISTVLAERIHNIYATIGLYGLATLTAYQRIYSDNHWFSDTVLGAAIGIVISRTVVRMNESNPYEHGFPCITIYPINRGYCLGLSFSL